MVAASFLMLGELFLRVLLLAIVVGTVVNPR